MDFDNERRISFNLEKIANFLNVAFLVLMLICLFMGWWWATFFLAIVNSLNYYYLYIQKKHTLLANFGILALFRYFVESIGPEFRQYLYSSDIEEKPFNRIERADVYKKAKKSGKIFCFWIFVGF